MHHRDLGVGFIVLPACKRDASRMRSQPGRTMLSRVPDLDSATPQIPARPGSIPRTALVNRLRASAPSLVVTVLAPAGYGKTTVLAQWAERDGRPFAWVSFEEGEDDPVGLCARVATALECVEPLDESVLAAAFSSLDHPVVLVLDGVHVLRSKACADILARLGAHVPDGSTLVLAGRTLPRGPIAR
ncbi:MAG: hypothetical protein ACRDNG_04670, partial [Gaiellaceae bacterium]